MEVTGVRGDVGGLSRLGGEGRKRKEVHGGCSMLW